MISKSTERRKIYNQYFVSLQNNETQEIKIVDLVKYGCKAQYHLPEVMNVDESADEIKAKISVKSIKFPNLKKKFFDKKNTTLEELEKMVPYCDRYGPRTGVVVYALAKYISKTVLKMNDKKGVKMPNSKTRIFDVVRGYTEVFYSEFCVSHHLREFFQNFDFFGEFKTIEEAKSGLKSSSPKLNPNYPGNFITVPSERDTLFTFMRKDTPISEPDDIAVILTDGINEARMDMTLDANDYYWLTDDLIGATGKLNKGHDGNYKICGMENMPKYIEYNLIGNYICPKDLAILFDYINKHGTSILQWLNPEGGRIINENINFAKNRGCNKYQTNFVRRMSLTPQFSCYDQAKA